MFVAHLSDEIFKMFHTKQEREEIKEQH